MKKHLVISGRVQGVGFRYWFHKEAIILNLKGYINNLNNGNEVESLIQGQKDNILYMIKKCKKGPKLAIVEKVISTNIISCEIYSEFIIK